MSSQPAESALTKPIFVTVLGLAYACAGLALVYPFVMYSLG
ncbi:MAG TPA: hypothetical protein VGI22_22395 [Xanthobacteraceae bacterium]|jgi:hypothetical protein